MEAHRAQRHANDRTKGTGGTNRSNPSRMVELFLRYSRHPAFLGKVFGGPGCLQEGQLSRHSRADSSMVVGGLLYETVGWAPLSREDEVSGSMACEQGLEWRIQARCDGDVVLRKAAREMCETSGKFGSRPSSARLVSSTYQAQWRVGLGSYL